VRYKKLDTFHVDVSRFTFHDHPIFGSLQGAAGLAYVEKFNIAGNVLNSFMLIEDDHLYTRSSGALRVFKHLGSGWKLLYAFIIIPKFIRDAVYNIIARNRYKWFGKKDACWVPTQELKKKFLD
jgi:predicted DCC family thiol-disulfide oxidoreductase YuxK